MAFDASSEVDSSSDSPQRKERLQQAFDRVSGTYDLLTALNPGYVRHLVRSARRLELGPHPQVLDLCCGTGRSTRAIERSYPDAQITAVDVSEGMLQQARRKRWQANVRFMQRDVSKLEEPSWEGCFDGVLMAYGIRNVPNPDAMLRRVLRWLKPGGRVCFHEYSVRGSRWSELSWKAVTSAIIIPAGAVVSRSAEIYRYLQRSVLEFDSVAQFEGRLRNAGFGQVHALPMDGWQRGIVHSFVARRPLAKDADRANVASQQSGD